MDPKITTEDIVAFERCLATLSDVLTTGFAAISKASATVAAAIMKVMRAAMLAPRDPRGSYRRRRPCLAGRGVPQVTRIAISDAT